MTNEKWLKEFVEEGAALEHTRWAGWQKYLHSKSIPMEHETNMPHCFCSPEKTVMPNGNMVIVHSEYSPLTIPFELVERWERQIKTPYSELSEVEKESDRREVRKYLPLIDKLLSHTRQEAYSSGFEDGVKSVKNGNS